MLLTGAHKVVAVLRSGIFHELTHCLRPFSWGDCIAAGITGKPIWPMLKGSIAIGFAAAGAPAAAPDPAMAFGPCIMSCCWRIYYWRKAICCCCHIMID